jgi:hypothetical protein
MDRWKTTLGPLAGTDAGPRVGGCEVADLVGTSWNHPDTPLPSPFRQEGSRHDDSASLIRLPLHDATTPAVMVHSGARPRRWTGKIAAAALLGP